MFHQGSDGLTSAYLAPSVGFNGTSAFDDADLNHGIATQSLFRVTDNNGDGLFGFGSDQSVAIVDNIRTTQLHQVNQLAIRDDSLFVTIGSSTTNGGIINGPSGDQTVPGESQYSGTLSFMEDLNAVGDTTNTAGFDFNSFTLTPGDQAEFDAVDLNSDDEISDFELSDAGVRTDTQAFLSTDNNKLRIHSTGIRNDYGLAINDDGEIFISENEENGTGREDQLFEATPQSDHGFPNANGLVDFRTDSELLDAGFFGADEGSIDVGFRASAGGLAFLGADAGDLEGDVLLSRFTPGDIALIDPNDPNADPPCTCDGPHSNFGYRRRPIWQLSIDRRWWYDSGSSRQWCLGSS